VSAARGGTVNQAADPAANLFGRWRPVNLDVVVEIQRYRDALVGTVVESVAEPAYVGGILLRNFRLDASGRRWVGEVFVVRRRAFTAAVITQTNVRMFVLSAGTGMASQRVNWVRR
jgi:hypothetical protein